MRFVIASLLLLVPAAASAAPVSFSRQIAPILAEQCVECHRAEKAKGSYRLDTVEQMLLPGDSGEPPLAAGQPEAGELFRLLVTGDEDDRMPKKADPLPPEQVALIREWITQGAVLDVKDRRAPLAALFESAAPRKAPGKYPRPIPVTALALNGDGRVLLTGGYHEVLSWNPEDASLRARIGGMPERVLGLSFVAGGPLLAVAGGTPGRSGEVWLVDYAKPARRQKLATLRDCALCAVSTPDGRHLVIGGADNRVRGFSLPEGRPLWDIEAHADWVLALAVSPDGRHVATASRDRTAKVLETATGTVEGTFTGHGVPVLSVAFTPSGGEVLSGGTDGQVRRWSLTGTGVKDSTITPAGRVEVLGLAFLDAGTPVVASASGQVHSLDIKTRKVRALLTTHEDRATALLLRPEEKGARLFTASHDGQVRLLQIAEEARELRRWTASPGW